MVSYHLQEINEDARARGDNAVYLKTLADGYLPQILATLETVKAIAR